MKKNTKIRIQQIPADNRSPINTDSAMHHRRHRIHKDTCPKHHLGADKPRDLGVRTDPAYFQDMLKKQGIQVQGPYEKLCLECSITYEDMKPADISITSSELSSWITETNKNGTLKDAQIKLGSGNNMELSANIDLKKYGYNLSGPIYASGSITKDGKDRLKIEINKAETGRIPIPGEYAEKGAEELENTINNQLARMPDLQIENLSVEDGIMHYKGNFPSVIKTG